MLCVLGSELVMMLGIPGGFLLSGPCGKVLISSTTLLPTAAIIAGSITACRVFCAKQMEPTLHQAETKLGDGQQARRYAEI